MGQKVAEDRCAVGTAATANISTETLTVDGRDVCRVHVEASGHPVQARIRKADSKGNQSTTTIVIITVFLFGVYFFVVDTVLGKAIDWVFHTLTHR